jgi:hypothetical protein
MYKNTILFSEVIKMIQMVFISVKECQECLNQININKGLVLPRKFDDVHEWYNVEHKDYINGGRASIMKPTGGGKPSRWLANCEKFSWIELEEDESWYTKIFSPEEDRIYPHG